MKRFCVTPYHNLYKNGDKCQFNRRAVSETVIQMMIGRFCVTPWKTIINVTIECSNFNRNDIVYRIYRN